MPNVRCSLYPDVLKGTAHGRSTAPSAIEPTRNSPASYVRPATGLNGYYAHDRVGDDISWRRHRSFRPANYLSIYQWSRPPVTKRRCGEQTCSHFLAYRGTYLRIDVLLFILPEYKVRSAEFRNRPPAPAANMESPLPMYTHSLDKNTRHQKIQCAKLQGTFPIKPFRLPGPAEIGSVEKTCRSIPNALESQRLTQRACTHARPR